MNPTTSPDRSSRGSRFDYEADDIVRQMIRPEDLKKSPEEYAARHAHEWGNFNFHLCRFRDPALGAWVRRFAEVFASGDELERWRAKYLTPDEVAEVNRREVEDL